MTSDLDQVLELLGLVVALLMAFPLLMAWFEDSLTTTEGEHPPVLPRRRNSTIGMMSPINYENTTAPNREAA